MRVCVTGATGFLGAHVVAGLVERGDEVRVTVRDRRRIAALAGRDVEIVDGDVLDRRSMRRALDGCDILFHTAGMVASRPRREVWRVNAIGPRIAVETAAECGVPRVVITSSVASIGPAAGDRPATERNAYPEQGTGLLYTDSKYEGERGALAAGARLGIEVVSVCPSYVLGPALNRTARGGDVDANRRQLPARPAAGDRRRLHEHRRRRGRRRRPPARGRERPRRRALHPRRRQPALVRGDRADRADLRSAAPADRAAARGRRRRRRAEARGRSLRACSRAFA